MLSPQQSPKRGRSAENETTAVEEGSPSKKGRPDGMEGATSPTKQGTNPSGATDYICRLGLQPSGSTPASPAAPRSLQDQLAALRAAGAALLPAGAAGAAAAAAAAGSTPSVPPAAFGQAAPVPLPPRFEPAAADAASAAEHPEHVHAPQPPRFQPVQAGQAPVNRLLRFEPPSPTLGATLAKLRRQLADGELVRKAAPARSLPPTATSRVASGTVAQLQPATHDFAPTDPSLRAALSGPTQILVAVTSRLRPAGRPSPGGGTGPCAAPAIALPTMAGAAAGRQHAAKPAAAAGSRPTQQTVAEAVTAAEGEGLPLLGRRRRKSKKDRGLLLTNPAALEEARSQRQPGVQCATVSCSSARAALDSSGWPKTGPQLKVLGEYYRQPFACAQKHEESLSEQDLAAFQASDEFKAAERLSSLGAALLHLAGTMSGELADRDRRRARHRELTSHLSESRAPLATLAGACPKRCNWLLDAKQPNWDTFIVPVPGAAAAAAAAGGA